MATTVDGFISGLITQLEGGTFDGDGLNAVVRAEPTPDVITRLPNYPAAIVTDRGGRRHRSSIALDVRRVEITLVDAVARDNIGHYTHERLQKMGDDLEDLLQADTTHGLVVMEDEEGAGYTTPTGGLGWVGKSWVFQYHLLLQTESDIYPNPGKVITGHGTNYAAGGTSLGQLLKTTVLGLVFNDELIGRPDVGTNVRHVRRLGFTALLSIIVANRSASVLGLIAPNMVVNSRTIAAEPQSDWKWGHILPDAAYTSLLIRPDNSVHQYWLAERALVTEVGPVLFAPDELHFAATELVVIATVNPEATPAITTPWRLGHPSDFPS